MVLYSLTTSAMGKQRSKEECTPHEEMRKSLQDMLASWSGVPVKPACGLYADHLWQLRVESSWRTTTRVEGLATKIRALAFNFLHTHTPQASRSSTRKKLMILIRLRSNLTAVSRLRKYSSELRILVPRLLYVQERGTKNRTIIPDSLGMVQML